MPRSIYTIEDRGNVYEVEADSPEQARAEVAKATAPGSGSAVYGDTGQPVTAGQERALQGMGTRVPGAPFAAGGLPAFAKPGDAAPTTGAYVDPRGSTVDFGAEPISKTLLAMGARTLSPRRLDGSQRPEAQSERLDAMQSAGLSIPLLGGKNELGALPEGMSSLLGGKGFSAGFDPALDAANERDRILRENHLLAYYGTGAAATALTAALTPVIRGGAMAGRVLGNAAIQGAQGAAAGFLGTDGTMADRRAGALVGGVLGGVGGGVGGAIEPRVRAVPQLTTALPAGVPLGAAQRAGRYVERQSRVPLASLESFSGNPNMTAAEAMGQRGKRAVGALGAQEGTTPDAFAELVLQRAEQRPQRLMDQFTSATGLSPQEAGGDIEAIVSAGRNDVKPLFDRATANPNPVSSPRLSAILGTPEGKKATRQVYADMLNDIDGPHPQAAGFMPGPDGVDAEMVAPTMEAWDRMYKQLGRQVERDPFGKPLSDAVSPGNNNINRLRGALREELNGLSPDWKAAMDQSADYKSAEAAFSMASKNLFSDMPSRTFAQGVAKLTSAERRAAIAGLGNVIFERAQKATLRPNTFKTNAVRDKLRALMGDDAANKLISSAEDEAHMMHFENRFGPNANAKTGDLKQAIKEQNDNPWKEAAVRATMAIPWGPAAMATAAGTVPLSRLASKIAAPKSTAWRDYAGQLMLDTPQNAAQAIKGIPKRENVVGRAIQKGAHSALTRGSGRFGGWSAN